MRMSPLMFGMSQSSKGFLERAILSTLIGQDNINRVILIARLDRNFDAPHKRWGRSRFHADAVVVRKQKKPRMLSIEIPQRYRLAPAVENFRNQAQRPIGVPNADA